MKSVGMKLFLVLAICVSGSALGCTEASETISADTRPQPMEVFEKVSHFMLISAIFKKLGPAARDSGSDDRHVFEWPVSDGRIFFVIAAEGCGKPYEVGYR